MKMVLALVSSLLMTATAACRSGDKGEAVLTDHGDTHTMDAPSVHGMLMVGDGPVYLSHLPMFHKPHDYQVLLEVELAKTGMEPTLVYAEDRRVTGEKVYTLVPEPFSLPELFTPSPDAPARKSFKARIVRGHFERGGSNLITGVTVTVKRVVHAVKFSKTPTPLPNLRYFLFGNETELFAAHVINMKPDFDHVVAARITSGVLTEEQAAAIRRGAVVDFPETANGVEQALKEGAQATGTVVVGGQPLTVTLEAPVDYYLETGDLEM